MIEEIYNKYLLCSGISTDTRTVQKDQMFFGLTGDNFNGNQYASKALEAGAKYAVVDKTEYAKGSEYILVDNCLSVLQKLATHHRKQLNIPVIGITGTNGKTSTKELLHAVLNSTFKCYSTKGNLNNHIGVPISVLSIDSSIEIAVIEMGANHEGEIGFLSKISQPTHGIITNIGKAHLEGFGNEATIKRTKGELFDYISKTKGKLFVCGDFNYLTEMSEGIDRILYGSDPKNNVIGTIKETFPFLVVECNNPEIILTSKLIGNYNLYNILAAVCVGQYFGVDPDKIKASIEQYNPSNNRSQIVRLKDNTFIMDAYNANPTSMISALNFFVDVPHDNKIVILGAMKELGTYSDKEHTAILDLVKSKKFKHNIFIGNEFIKHADHCPGDYFGTIEEAQEWFQEMNFESACFLVKGSRSMQLEKILS